LDTKSEIISLCRATLSFLFLGIFCFLVDEKTPKMHMFFVVPFFYQRNSKTDLDRKKTQKKDSSKKVNCVAKKHKK
jgi:hypothetical protein